MKGKEPKKVADIRRAAENYFRDVGAELTKLGEVEYGREFLAIGSEILQQKVFHGNWKAVKEIDGEICNLFDQMKAERYIWKDKNNEIIKQYYMKLSEQMEKRWIETHKKYIGFWQKIFNRSKNEDKDKVFESGIKISRLEGQILRQQSEYAKLDPVSTKALILKESIKSNTTMLGLYNKQLLQVANTAGLGKTVKLLEDIQMDQGSENSETLLNLTAKLNVLIDAISKGFDENSILLQLASDKLDSVEKSVEGGNKKSETILPASPDKNSDTLPVPATDTRRPENHI